MFKQEINDICEQENYIFSSLIHFSERKRTALAVLLIHDKEVIGKFSFCEQIDFDFRRELEFYKKFHRTLNIPTLIHYSATFFIISKLNGPTLFSYLDDNSLNNIDKSSIANKAIYLLNDFFECGDEIVLKVNERKLKRKLFDKIKVLLFSGPMGSKKNTVLYKLVVRTFFYLLLPVLSFNMSKDIKLLKAINYNFGKMSHGDMHLNNIMVQDKELFLIDFEKVENQPYSLVDLLFMLGTLSPLMEEVDLVNILHKNNSKCIPPADFLISLFLSVSKINPRFLGELSFKSVYRLSRNIIRYN
jgi:hypothetical protein